MATRASKKKEMKSMAEGGVFDLKALDLGDEFVTAQDYTHADVKDWVPTGIPEVDSALTGGLPMGRVIELYSPNNVGKTTLAIQINRQANSIGIPVFWFDVEGTNNRSHLEEMGVNMEMTSMYQPKDTDTTSTAIENIADQMEKVMTRINEAGIEAIFIWDSVGASMSKKTILGEYDDQQPGREAKAMTRALAKLTPLAASTNNMIVLINQIRDKMGAVAFGPQTDTPGGKALKHYATFRISLAKTKSNKLGGNEFGHQVKLKLEKSKLGQPRVTAEGVILFGKYGFNEAVNLLASAAKNNIIKSSKSGAKKYSIPNIDTGEVVDLYERDLPELIESGDIHNYDKSLAYIENQLVQMYFPGGYPALENQNYKISNSPILASIVPPDKGSTVSTDTDGTTNDVEEEIEEE